MSHGLARFYRLAAVVGMLGGMATSLSGCGSVLTSSTAVASGIAGTAIAAQVTSNATIASGIGIGVGAAANAGLQYAERRVHRYEQDRIAAIAGSLPMGQVANWQVSHDVPIEEDENGQVVVTRDIGTPQFACREIVFSVHTTEHSRLHRAFYTAMVCRDGNRWKWASAEPATERWGSLQ